MFSCAALLSVHARWLHLSCWECMPGQRERGTRERPRTRARSEALSSARGCGVQYFLPSAYRSYAVELRKDRPKPTTKPVMVSRIELIPKLTFGTSIDIVVMRVAQAATTSSGTIILGRMLPCICMNRGHFECLDKSRGPDYRRNG